jgi:hypothetical protein
LTRLSFRHDLRQQTQAQHVATEHGLARFTAAPIGHLPWFLATQRAGLWAVFCSADPAALICTPVLHDLIARLDADLAATGTTAHPAQPLRGLDPLAVDYLILGSRLGTEVLRRQIFADQPPSALPAYFQLSPQPDLWRAHCAALDAIDPASARAAAVIADTNTAFSLFQQAARRQDTPEKVAAL